MDLSEYINVEERCRGLINDINGLIQKVKNLKNEIEEIESIVQQEISSISTNKEEYVRQSIANKMYSSTHTKAAEHQALSISLSQLQSHPYHPDKLKLSQEFIQEIDLYTTVLAGTRKDRNQNKILFDIIRQNDIMDLSSVSKNKLKSELRKYQKGLLRVKEFKEYSLITTQFIDRIFAVSTLFRFLEGWKRLVFLLGYYTIVILAIIVCMPLLVCTYFYISTQFLKSDSKFRKEQIKSIRNVTIFEKIAKELKSRISIDVKTKIAKDMENHLIHKASKIKEIKHQIKTLSDEISQEQRLIQEEMTLYSKTDNYEKEQHTIIKQKYQGILDELVSSLETTEQLLEEMQTEQDVLIVTRNNGKKELEDTYFKLDKCGVTKILPTQFLLGFNDYTPITMDMPQYCINLLTNSRTEQLNVDFVVMCIAQILCTTNPSCIKLSIVDINNGTSNFGIFNNIPAMLTVIKTHDELDKTLARLFQLKADRDRDIKQKADDITKYNQGMIDNYGITLPYEILIVTHHIESLIGNQIYRQLQTAGNLGIVTITMWDNSILRFNPKNNKEYYLKLIPFMSTVSNVIYYGSGTLSTLTPTYIEDKLNDIKKALRSLP